jgi:hypothetical protein
MGADGPVVHWCDRAGEKDPHGAGEIGEYV